MFFKKWRSKPPIETPATKAIRLLEALTEEDFKAVYSSDMSIHTVTVAFDNIESYYLALYRYIDALLSDQLIPAHTTSSVMVEVSVNTFFLDKKGCYLDVAEMVQLWIRHAKTFLEVYERIEQNYPWTFESEKNLRLVQPIFVNLLYLADVGLGVKP